MLRTLPGDDPPKLMCEQAGKCILETDSILHSHTHTHTLTYERERERVWEGECAPVVVNVFPDFFLPRTAHRCVSWSMQTDGLVVMNTLLSLQLNGNHTHTHTSGDILASVYLTSHAAVPLPMATTMRIKASLDCTLQRQLSNSWNNGNFMIQGALIFLAIIAVA